MFGYKWVVNLSFCHHSISLSIALLWSPVVSLYNVSVIYASLFSKYPILLYATCKFVCMKYSKLVVSYCRNMDSEKWEIVDFRDDGIS